METTSQQQPRQDPVRRRASDGSPEGLAPCSGSSAAAPTGSPTSRRPSSSTTTPWAGDQRAAEAQGPSADVLHPLVVRPRTPAAPTPPGPAGRHRKCTAFQNCGRHGPGSVDSGSLADRGGGLTRAPVNAHFPSKSPPASGKRGVCTLMELRRLMPRRPRLSRVSVGSTSLTPTAPVRAAPARRSLRERRRSHQPVC